MFGYVRPCKEELKLKEYNLFKAVYCGLCKTLGESANQLTRFGLNYDFTFLALILIALDKEEPQINQEACIANPFKKKPVVKKNRNLEYVADMSNIFVYLKLIDDWRDEHSLKSLITLPIYYFPIRRKKRKYNDKYNYFIESLQELAILESNKNGLLDKSADLFSRIMARIFRPDYITNEKEERILQSFGYNLGRWIYILDAFSDLEEDIENGTYNPLLLQYKYEEDEGLGNFIDRVKDPIEFTLTFTLNNLAKSYELLDLYRYNSILDNIIYIGLYQVMNKKLMRSGREFERSIQSTGIK